MVPYEAFACRCGTEDVVLRESYKPKAHEERVRLLTSSPGASSTPSYSPGPSTPPSYSPVSSTPQSYSSGSSKNTECSCKHLLDKIIILKATVEMYMHPEQHTVNSAALLHEVYNDMKKIDFELFVIWNVIRML
nr:hypothetical protein [Tanacetum cinerariifolium]